MTFNAKYFDGKSSQTFSSEVKVENNKWKIIFYDSHNQLKEVHWNTNQIKNSEVFTKGLIAFSYGDNFPFQRIESTDENFINYTYQNPITNNQKIDTFLHKSVWKSLTGLLIFILGFSLLMYFYIIPGLALSFVEKLPKKQVESFGNYVFQKLSTSIEFDNQRTKLLQDFVDQLHINTEFKIDAYIAKSSELNAFALSGGKFVIYTGLLDKIENEHQLTALIGHEVSHINERHVLKSISKNLSGALFLSIILGDVNAVYSIVLENAHAFSQLSFSRTLEKEADVFGLEIMKTNNVDLHGMPELFKILKDNHSIEIPSFLGSHPMLDDRITYTETVANEQNSFSENSILKEKWELLKVNESTQDTTSINE